MSRASCAPMLVIMSHRFGQQNVYFFRFGLVLFLIFHLPIPKCIHANANANNLKIIVHPASYEEQKEFQLQINRISLGFNLILPF